jgi:hypothetical protein
MQALLKQVASDRLDSRRSGRLPHGKEWVQGEGDYRVASVSQTHAVSVFEVPSFIR